MTKDEALKLALVALEEINQLSIGENAVCLPAEIDTAMDAIKEALAQPEQDGKCKYCTDGCPACDARKLPEQERFLVATIGNWGRVEWADGVFPSLGDKMYSAPRTWVGLTLDEVLDMARTFGAQPWPPNSCAALGKMIEAKLKEKNT